MKHKRKVNVMKMLNTIEANDETKCNACGRVHRKLFLVDGGYWLGKNCAEDLKLYHRDNNRDSLMWRGYEKRYDKIANMVK